MLLAEKDIKIGDKNKMKKKFLSILLAVCMVVTMMPTVAWADSLPTATEYAADATNAKTTGDYWIDGTTLTIYTPKGAAFWSANGADYLDYTVKLANNINVSGFLWTPVGDSSHEFTGTFDGQGHTISGLTVTAAAVTTQGFAGVIGCSSGTVKNLTVSGSVNVTGSGNIFYNVGGIVGTNNGVVDNCVNHASVTGSGVNYIQAGGISGSNFNTIRNCVNTGSVMAAAAQNSDAGGITGHSEGSVSVSNCYNTGAVSASGGAQKNCAGGIAGDSWALQNCYSTGTITATGSNNLSGGISGEGGTLENCYYKSGTANVIDNSMNSATGCGTFADYGGALTAGTAANCDTDQTLAAYATDLLSALNGWVNDKASADYYTWKADSGNVNGGYPMLDKAWAEPTVEAKWGVAKADGTAPATWVGSGTLTDAVSYANGLSGSTAYIQLQSDVDTTASLTFNGGNTSILDLNGKTIDGKNISESNATVFTILSGANVTLTDTGNDAAANPGKITGGDYGMQVYGNFSMLGGSITGNGKGVYAYGGSCTMLGGSVTGNTNGGVGVNSSSFTIGGNAVITGNTSGTGADQIAQNVLLYQKSDVITVSTDKPLESGTPIGVTTRNFFQSDRVNITGANSTDYSGYFTSDSENYKILNSGTGNAQVVTLIANNIVTVSAGTNGGVAANAGTTGAITSGTTRVMAGETVTITPAANSGYKVGTVSVCKTDNPDATVAVSHNTFTMPAYAVTISVTFQAANASSSSSSPTVNTDKTETKVDPASNTATVTTKPDSVNATGNTTSIETTIPSVTVDNTQTSTNGSVVDTAKKSSVTINVPTEAILQQLAAKKDVELTVTVPHDVAKNTVGGAAITINANKEILEAAKENLTDVTIKIKDADTQQMAYSWTFKGEDLAKSTTPMTDVNIAMSVHLTTEVPKVNAVTPANKGLVLSFDHSGVLPSVASVKISALDKGFKPGQTLYFYYYNPTTKQIESFGKDAYTVGSDGYVTVQIVHCSDYVLLPKAVRTITLDTRTYTMRPKKSYETGIKLTGISNTIIKAYSSTKGVANVTVLKNGDVKATGVKPGLTYIMIDVYDSKNKFLTHASVRLTVQNGVKEYGNSARQYGIF